MHELCYTFTHAQQSGNPIFRVYAARFMVKSDVGFVYRRFFVGSMGRDRIIMIMVAVYMALVAVTNLPYVPQFGASVSLSNGFILKIGTFLGLFAILFFMLTRSALNHAIGGNGALGKWWHVLILSFLQVGMLISVVMSFLPAVWLEGLAALTRTVFVSAWGKFGWSLLPIFGLLVIGMSNERDRSNSYD